MEFLKAFQQAQTMGLTKEEFFNVWESESTLKMKKQGDGLTPQWNPYGNEQHLQNQGVDDQGSSVDSVDYQLKDNWLQNRQEFSLDLYLKLDHLCKHLMEKQEQFWQQMNLKYDQQLQELRSRFEILSNYVKDNADSQANSLKLYFMHEIDLLKQDLKRLVMDQNVRNETGLVSSQQIVPQENARNFSQPGHLVSGQISSENKPNQKLNKSKHKQFQQTQQDLQLYQCDLPEPGIDFALDGKCDSIAHNTHQIISGENKILPKTVQNIPVKSYANVASLSTPAESTPSNYACMFDRTSDSLHSAPILCSSSVVSAREGSVAATGLFASFIANQMKHKQSSSVKSSSRSENTTPVKTNPSKIAGKIGIPSSLPDITSKHHKFTVTNCSHLSVSNQPFLSPTIVSKGKACRARISVAFEKSGQLTVNVLVSKGVKDDNHKWPLILDGCGYILNPGSKRGTPLWSLKSATCQKPRSSADEFVFPAEVCLMTSKCDYKNVTYKELIIRYKTEENNLIFTWELQASEWKKAA